MTDKIDELKAALQIALTVGDIIREVGRIPSGHLYALLIGKMNMQTYEAIIAMLKRTKLVDEKNHELIWIGPAKKENSK